jgi:uncharacterized protein (DUF433 family)
MISDGDISTENVQFLDAAVARGVFPSREAALDQALRLLRRRQEVFDQFERLARELPSPMPSVLESRPGGIFVVRGHRITLHLIAEFYFGGLRDPRAMQERFPTLSLDDVCQILSYIAQNEAALSAYHEANQRCCDEWRRPARRSKSCGLGWRRLRRRERSHATQAPLG